MILNNLGKKMLVLALGCIVVEVNASEELLQKRIDELSDRIQELEQKTDNNSDSITSLVGKDLKNAVTFNGFASFGLSQFDEGGHSETYYNGQGSKLDVKPNTWLGLQMMHAYMKAAM